MLYGARIGFCTAWNGVILLGGNDVVRHGAAGCTEQGAGAVRHRLSRSGVRGFAGKENRGRFGGAGGLMAGRIGQRECGAWQPPIVVQRYDYFSRLRYRVCLFEPRRVLKERCVYSALPWRTHVVWHHDLPMVRFWHLSRAATTVRLCGLLFDRRSR